MTLRAFGLVLCAAFAAHFSFVFAQTADAAVPVEDAGSTGSAASGLTPTPIQVDGETGQLRELFYQIQVLRQEVQELRGLVEEQGYQVKRLTRDQKDQYVDLDRRLAELRAGGVVAAASDSADPGAGSVDDPRAPVAAGGAAGSERSAYADAFNLMKAREFEASAAAFDQLIIDYPNGQYTVNAFYWLGELHLASSENEQARQAFVQVVTLYPDHQKVADALYKLGVVYHRLGDKSRSLEYLNRAQQEFPDSSAAGLAATYARELQ
jgi:tol-pal system protein YbgF